MDECGVDIALPYALYRDLLYFGQHSLTLPGNRSALLATEQTQNGADAVRLLQNAAKIFDQRRGAVRATISSPLHAMEIKVARNANLESKRLSAESSHGQTFDRGLVARPALSERTVAPPEAGTKPTTGQQALALMDRPEADWDRLQNSDA